MKFGKWLIVDVIRRMDLIKKKLEMMVVWKVIIENIDLKESSIWDNRDVLNWFKCGKKYG